MTNTPADANALDPKRPWIDDERQLPSRMNWFDTLFNPAGKSSRLHFTRAWTLLFMLQFAAFVGLAIFGVILTALGASSPTFGIFSIYTQAIVFVVTGVISFIIHARRLNDAKKPVILSIILLLPLIAAGYLFTSTLSGKAAAYDKLYDQRAEYLADPQAWEEKKLEGKRKAQAAAAEARAKAEAARAEAEAKGEDVPEQQGRRGGGQGRGGWNRGPSAENPLPTQEAFVLRPAAGAIIMPMIGLNFLIMIWTLLWVARVPYFGGKGRLEDDLVS